MILQKVHLQLNNFDYACVDEYHDVDIEMFDKHIIQTIHLM